MLLKLSSLAKTCTHVYRQSDEMIAMIFISPSFNIIKGLKVCTIKNFFLTNRNLKW